MAVTEEKILEIRFTERDIYWRNVAAGNAETENSCPYCGQISVSVTLKEIMDEIVVQCKNCGQMVQVTIPDSVRMKFRESE